ncbi:hypothetical protein [Streptomyces hirsutus]|uniref:hypothetical protein n=1 Tax=Streptomyces hirsutus TaxID=35620 RepID=UPI0036A407FB
MDGFGLSGIPSVLITALLHTSVSQLRIVSAWTTGDSASGWPPARSPAWPRPTWARTAVPASPPSSPRWAMPVAQRPTRHVDVHRIAGGVEHRGEERS